MMQMMPQNSAIRSSLAGVDFAARRASPAARSLAIGFAATVSMWAVAYVAMMHPGKIAGDALFAVTLLCLFKAGMSAGRNRVAGESGWIAGVKAALVTATLNMLLIGSLIGGKSSGEMMKHFLLWTAGNYALTVTITALGGAMGGRQRGNDAAANAPFSSRNWFSLFTRIAAATVFLLLITGGLVTGLEAGLAVPDWPNSFGHNMLLYPLSQMIGGVYYEHAHRLYGMLVGVTAITLALSAFFFDQRKWVRSLIIAWLLMVCLQGVLGGTRVTERNITLAIIHGIFGQIVFATACAIAAVTSPAWIANQPAISKPSASTDRTWSTLLVAALLLQLLLGALYRHLRHVHVLYTHALWAAFVTGLAIFAGGRAWANNREQPILSRNGKAVIHTVSLQIVLGVVAMIAVLSRPESVATMAAGTATTNPIEQIPLWEIIFTTAHQAVGALLLGLATTLMCWTRRLLRVE